MDSIRLILITAKTSAKFRLAVDMDIHGYIHGYIHIGYIHVWISDFSRPVDMSMDIVLSHLLIKLNI